MIQTMTTLLYGKPIGVIRLEDDGFCAFQYTPEFCRSGLAPAPLQMPAVPDRIYKFTVLDPRTFNGLPGMIADSLPDSFGQALLDQWLSANGRAPGEANALEKLSFQGNRGMGALEFEPARASYWGESTRLEMDTLIETAREALQSKEHFLSCLKDKEQAVLDILKIGTSAGGQRAKAVIALNDKTKEIRSGQVPAPEGFDYWLIKFDGFDSDGKPVSPANFGRREYAFHRSILDAGIEMAECRLLEENGRAHFMTRRFDREQGDKIHMQTLCALAHYDFRRPGAYSYEQAFQVMRRLNLGYEAARELFRRMVFNLMSVNMDDHTKNISFLMSRSGRWRLSPAYDMGFCYNPRGQWANAHQMSVAGKRDHITKSDLLVFAAKQDIKDPEEVIQQVEYGISRFPEHADDCGVPKSETDYIMAQINERRKELTH